MQRLTSTNEAALVARLQAIAPDAEPVFGSMSPARMMAHLERTFEISLGEHEMAMIRVYVPRALLRWMVLSPMPWPKGKLKAPPQFTPDADAFEPARNKAVAALRRFVAFAEAHPLERRNSPLAGPLTMHQWQRLHFRHLEHHLVQFNA